MPLEYQKFLEKFQESEIFEKNRDLFNNFSNISGFHGSSGIF
jgi:hypothetical protein